MIYAQQASGTGRQRSPTGCQRVLYDVGEEKMYQIVHKNRNARFSQKMEVVFNWIERQGSLGEARCPFAAHIHHLSLYLYHAAHSAAAYPPGGAMSLNQNKQHMPCC